MCTLKIEVKVAANNIHYDAIRWRISTSIKVLALIFTLALTVFVMLMFQLFDLEYLGHGHLV